MSLFPAYAQDSSEYSDEHEGSACVKRSSSPSWEAALLASDNDDEREPPQPPPPANTDTVTAEQHFYFDHKLDFGNMRVSTIYYPGRPQYSSLPARCALGAVAGAETSRRVSRRARYHAAGAAPPPPLDHSELAARTAAYLDLLADDPQHEQMWINFIDFQERCRDAEAALSAAERACERMPQSRRLCAELHRARTAALPPLRRLQLLREELSAGAGAALPPARLVETWARLVQCAAAAGGAEAQRAAAAAVSATRAVPAAYPHLLYEYGASVRAAGHWERLVLLLELLVSMNFPPAAFPPHTDPQRLALHERNLQQLEDKIVESGLPLSVVWTRVERARGAAHWRGEAGAGAGAGDPLRAPQPADVADLLLPAHPAAAHLLLLTALRLAKVPVMPCSQHMLTCCDASNSALGDGGALDSGEALLGLVRAARRLPSAHPARPSPALAARVLALLAEPPHYFSDDTGYLSWVTSLWEAACGWTSGARRTALVCWRLRWLHALLLVVEADAGGGAGEARRVLREGRGVLKRWAGDSALPYAQWARLQHAAGDARAARAAALHALTHALNHPDHTILQRLYVARVACEVCGDSAGAWGTVCAALGRGAPAADLLAHPPPTHLLHDATAHCEARCSELERGYSEGEGGGDAGDALGAMLPAAGEWAAARVRLASPARRRDLLAHLLLTAHRHTEGEAARYYEQSACALVVEAAREHRQAHVARRLLALYPHNALIALACSGAPLWAWDGDMSGSERLRALGAAERSHVAALSSALPALLRAAGGWEGGAAARLAAACARAGRRGAGGALLAAARLEAEARAPAGRARAALLAALEAHAAHKWLGVRGAGWVCEEASALHDALLERGLRVHALLDELTPLLQHNS